MKKATWIFTYIGFGSQDEVVQADTFDEARAQFLAQVPQPCSMTKEALLDGWLLSIKRYNNNRNLILAAQKAAEVTK